MARGKLEVIGLASMNLLTKEMLTPLGSILKHCNGLKWYQTLDSALIGNLRRGPGGPPKYGTYVTAEAHHLNIFARDLDSPMRHHHGYLL